MSLYWDIKKPLSYNCLFNFIIGNRGAGKTYGSLKFGIENFEKAHKRGEEYNFIYVRRYATELEKLTKSHDGRLFKAVQAEFPEHTLTAESNTLKYDKKVMGYAVPLSTASILKSDSFPFVQDIFFDEFIIDNRGTYHYLKDEVTKFLDLYETVARGRDVRVWFLSNAVSVTNPYFDYFHLDKPFNGDLQRFGKAKQILVQNVVPKQLAEIRKKSRFGQIIEGSEYSDYAFDNQWLLDNTDFVETKTRRSHYYMTMYFKGKPIGIWRDTFQGIFYISDDVDLQSPIVFSATTDDHKPNVMLFAACKNEKYIQNIKKAYQLGCVRYESLQLKNDFREIMRMANFN